ncbi:hypothetical protein M948_20400 [Virgibacillus sp. CM-4]|nr:hypothetical protein M948_20400 [Virgibacillus sp. CM-4]
MLSSYQELYESEKVKADHLFIGNGFSINLWGDFNGK